MRDALSLVVFVLVMSLAALVYLGRRGFDRGRGVRLLRRMGYLGLAPSARAIATPVLSVGPTRYIDVLLRQAGVRISAGRFSIVALAVFALTAVLAATRLAPGIAIVIGVVVATLGSLAYLLRERSRRLRSFARQLPYVLDILRAALESGHTVARGLQAAADHVAEPMASELRAVVDQVQVGVSLPQALDNLSRRVPDENLGFLAASVRIQAEVGASLSEVVQQVNDLARNAQRLRQQVRTLTAQARMSAVIVTVLPLVVLGALAWLRPDYVGVLFTSAFGQRMLEIALALDCAAALVMGRLARVEY